MTPEKEEMEEMEEKEVEEKVQEKMEDRGGREYTSPEMKEARRRHFQNKDAVSPKQQYLSHLHPSALQTQRTRTHTHCSPLMYKAPLTHCM